MREELMNKLLTVLATVMGLLGFIKLIDMKEQQPEYGIPLILILGVLYVIAALIGYREKQ
jgi:predicted membrane channel-forming protein YqfA (hemolysin III family)